MKEVIFLIFHFEIKRGNRKWHLKTYFVSLLSFILNFSASFVIDDLKFGMHVTHIDVKGKLCLRFLFCTCVLVFILFKKYR